jgi:hypothetical protein
MPGGAAPPAPGVQKPTAYNTPGGQPMQPQGTAVPSGATLTVQSLTIMATNVTIAGGGAAGVAGSGAPVAPGVGAGVQQAGAGMPSMQSLMGGGGYLGNLMQGMQRNPSLQGLLSGLLSPLGAAGGGALSLAHIISSASVAQSQPLFEAQLGMDIRREQGGFVGGLERSMNTSIARQKGFTNWSRTLTAPMDMLFPSVNAEWYHDQERSIAMAETARDTAPARGRYGAMTGNYLTGGEGTQLMMGGAEMSRSFGTRAMRMWGGPGVSSDLTTTRGMKGMLFNRDGSPKWGESDILGAVGAFDRYAMDPANIRMRNARMAGEDPFLDPGNIADLRLQMIGRGDMSGLAAIQPMSYFRNGMDSGLTEASRYMYRQSSWQTQGTVSGISAGVAGTRASLYGTATDQWRAARMGVGSVQSEASRVGESLPYLNDNERAVALAKLKQLGSEELAIRENANRNLLSVNTGLAQVGSAIASTVQQRATMLGVGGVELFGHAQASYERQAGTTAEIKRNLDYLGQRIRANNPGADPMRNTEYANMYEAYERSQTATTAAGIARAELPLSIGLQRSLSQSGYQIGVMSSLPGTYGNIRGALQGQMGTLETASREITSRREAQRAANGGVLSEPEEFAYQRQLQDIGGQQASTYGQLAYGWESRLMSQAVNMPGSFSFASPFMTHRAAVGSGVLHPSMGATGPNLPAFMRQAGMLASIAGSTGTPEGYAMTAMSGASARNGFAMPSGGVLNASPAADMRAALDGVTINLRITMPNGAEMTVPGSVSTRGNVDTSPAALAEQDNIHRKNVLN